jgi:hypothetical protein
MTQPTKRSTTTAVVPSTLNTTDITAPDNARHDGWTRERMIGFLEALVETASVSIAAQSVGMTRQTAYRLRARLIGQPFDHAWEAALEFGLQQLHCEALDRAMNGVPVPIYFGGEQVGERRQYNETLTRFLLDNPNARAKTRHGPEVRAAALEQWNNTMKRVQTGPIVWTPEEKKKAGAVAAKITTELQAMKAPAKAARPRKPKLDKFGYPVQPEIDWDNLPQEEYDRLLQRAGIYR